jgi:transposase
MTLTIAPVDGQILKRDTAGRVRTPRERREALLVEFDRSGMSGQKFAAWAGMKYTTFANWLQRRRKQRQSPSGAKGTDAVQWVQAVVGNRLRQKPGVKPGAVGLIVHGPGGVRIEIHEEKQVDWAAKLLRSLDGAESC